mmetsp:Transcript_27961/g.24633  ORF Transcript_27961/g.24633 Transcript_27961/m.24633 type:complete len:264 (-) Transcript_27961:1593-2384(-)
MRTDLLGWINNHSDGLKRIDLKGQVEHIVAALLDRNKEIRYLAESLLEKCVGVIGGDPFFKYLRDQNQTVQNDLVPVVAKYAGEMDVEGAPSINTSHQNVDTSSNFAKPGLKKNATESNLHKNKPAPLGKSGSSKTLKLPTLGNLSELNKSVDVGDTSKKTLTSARHVSDDKAKTPMASSGSKINFTTKTTIKGGQTTPRSNAGSTKNTPSFERPASKLNKSQDKSLDRSINKKHNTVVVPSTPSSKTTTPKSSSKKTFEFGS